MQKIIQKIGLILIVIGLITVPVWAEELTIATLIDYAPEYDKKVVTLKGEAIGELLERGDHAWVNMNDGTGAIGVYIGKEDALKIKKWGNYHCIGDVISVTGKFHKTWGAQGGDMAIEGEALNIVIKGKVNAYKIEKEKIIFVYTLAPLACVFGWIKFKNGKKIKRIKKQII